MFTWVGTQFDGVLDTYVLGTVTRLSTGITPIALTAMTIWVLVYGWAVIRNEAPDTVPLFIWKVFKIGLVLSLSLQAGFYISSVADTANSLATSVANTFLPSAADPTTIKSPYALIDAFNDKASQLVLDLLKEAGITRLDLVFAVVVCSFGNVIFLCVALFVVTLSKMILTFTIAVGPLFIFCLAWKPTQRFFDSWLSMMLNAIVMTWFAFFALGLSTFMGDAIVTTVQANGGFIGPNFNVVGEGLKYCVVMILMALVCFQAPSLAAALTGGPVVQQGIQMIQSAMYGSRPDYARPGPGTGGTIRGGTGVAYAAGRAAGSAVSASARAATDAKQIPTYVWSAMRGRKR